MSVSKKQLHANRKNAKKGGVKTKEGKAVTRMNALKHGLLAKEIVVNVGGAVENHVEFDALVASLIDEFQPCSAMECMLVEKIAVAWWRLRRVYRCENGLIRDAMEQAERDYVKQLESSSPADIPQTDIAIDSKVNTANTDLYETMVAKRMLGSGPTQDMDLKETYEFKTLWYGMYNYFATKGKLPLDFSELTPEVARETLAAAGVTDDQIWAALREMVDVVMHAHKEHIDALKYEKVLKEIAEETRAMKCSIPAHGDMEHLLRYETAIERQFYKAIAQLERIQRRRAGEYVSPPAQGDLSIDMNAAS